MLVALVLAGCATAHAASAPEAPGVLALSAGRLGALGGGLLGLASAITGGLGLRSVLRGDAALGRRRRALGGLIAGVLGAALGALVVATAEGGVGTGGGVGGALIAVPVGLIGALLNGLSLARVRRTDHRSAGGAGDSQAQKDRSVA